MIDIETKVYNIIYDAVTEKYPDTIIYGDYVREITKFPCVMVVELDNSSFKKTIDTSGLENHSKLMYQIDIFTVGDDKKITCKNIRNLIDKKLFEYGFTRLFSNPAEFEKANVYRIVSRYECIVDRNNKIYRK